MYKVSVQAPFKHRYRFKSIDLAPVSKKKIYIYTSRDFFKTAREAQLPL